MGKGSKYFGMGQKSNTTIIVTMPFEPYSTHTAVPLQVTMSMEPLPPMDS